jgi:hypothetical protein
MNLQHDYIIAEQANMIDLNNFTKQIKCVFIGTKKFFFAIPYNMVDFTPGYTVDTTETVDMYYEGMPLQEFLLEKVKEPGLAVDDFEKFVIEQDFNDIQMIDIEKDITKFQVKASFLGSGILYNKSGERRDWKPFVLRYKKEKMGVKQFYSNHPKRVEKLNQ